MKTSNYTDIQKEIVNIVQEINSSIIRAQELVIGNGCRITQNIKNQLSQINITNTGKLCKVRELYEKLPNCERENLLVPNLREGYLKYYTWYLNAYQTNQAIYADAHS